MVSCVSHISYMKQSNPSLNNFARRFLYQACLTHHKLTILSELRWVSPSLAEFILHWLRPGFLRWNCWLVQVSESTREFDNHANYDWTLQHFEVENDFLHQDLQEELYMKVQPGFGMNLGNQVCRLKKVLYGFKQYPRAWFGNLLKQCWIWSANKPGWSYIVYQAFDIRGSHSIDSLCRHYNNWEWSRWKGSSSEAFRKRIQNIGSWEIKVLLGNRSSSVQGRNLFHRKIMFLICWKKQGKLRYRPLDTPTEPNHRLGKSKGRNQLIINMQST